jgi:hypothetical protein
VKWLYDAPMEPPNLTAGLVALVVLVALALVVSVPLYLAWVLLR